MAPPFRRHEPAATAIPQVFDSPHSGKRYPADFDHAPPRAEVRRAKIRTFPGFVLGDRGGTTCAATFTTVADALRALGYDVAINDPYKGVEIVRRHGRPAEGRHSLQIEVNRRLYMDESTLEPNAGYPRLERDLDRLVAAVAGFVRRALA